MKKKQNNKLKTGANLMSLESYRILEIDPYLKSHEGDINLRMERYASTKKRLLGDGGSLSGFANGHMHFGFHPQKPDEVSDAPKGRSREVKIKKDMGWVYREWAPNASAMHLIGDFNGWDRASHPMKPLPGGTWEICVPGKIPHGSKVKIQVEANGQTFDRIPTYCKRAIQDPHTLAFDGQVWHPDKLYAWTDSDFHRESGEPLMIYECHIGMSGENAGIATFQEFTDSILPRIKKLGYNAVQLMAIMEHPYYGSFGYQVTNFYAVSSRFGTPEDLKSLINTAHSMGISVFLDLIHSHAARNEAEGLGRFDGTDYQFFHSGALGNHPAWDTRLFDYNKPEVLHFLLSNLKYWLDEYHFDGFRFDGVTSMLYHDHGLGSAFDNYDKYFSMNTDVEAVTYLQLASDLCKEICSNCTLIAEDMSGMPGMCLPVSWGGIGFDYRLGMGLPDYWIRLLKTTKDENWHLGTLWHELTTRRPLEKVIGYCESHDQALVGDKTIMFWLADKEMYWHMGIDSQNQVISRAIALHKMIRLITCACGGDGYLNFMGNEFGHPEWIDFPREGNGWSYHYARRQWSLASNPELRYKGLQDFDEAMVHLIKESNIPACPSKLEYVHEDDKVIIFSKGSYLFIFNFHYGRDWTGRLPSLDGKECEIALHSGWEVFGGYKEKSADRFASGDLITVWPRCAVVLRAV